MLTNFDDLSKVDGVTLRCFPPLKTITPSALLPFATSKSSGPKSAASFAARQFCVTLYALAGMLVYIAFRFEWVYGAAAVLAVFHDVLITLGFFSLLHFEISLTVIAALLTLVGYSMNDTIVIFDRIRENNRLLRQRIICRRRQQVHQSDTFANDLDQRSDLPHRARSVSDGRPGASRFLLCPGGRDCGRNVLQFWHRCSAGRRVESLAGPRCGDRHRTRSR